MKLNNITNLGNNISKINYKQKLVAKTIPNQDSTQNKQDNSYRIYKLEEKDHDYFINMLSDWQDGELILCALDDFDNDFKKYHFYVLENQKKNCLGYAQIRTSNKKQNELMYIETAPKYSHKNKENRTTKYIGETLISFLVALTQKDKDKDFVVPHTLLSAEGFYVKGCGFKKDRSKGICTTYKPKEEFQQLIKQNQNHTGATIEFVC